MAKGNHSFTEQDIRKRFSAIVGHTVAEVDSAGVLAASKASRNKGRIGAIILSCLADLGYTVEWRVVNSAEYGFPQRRKRVYIFCEKDAGDSDLTERMRRGVMAKAFPAVYPDEMTELDVLPDPYENSTRFGVGRKVSQFKAAGVMQGCHVLTCDFAEEYRGERRVLGDVLVDESDVPDQFYIAEEKLSDWRYLKGAKREERTNKKTGFTYTYSEGAMSFPDSIEKPSRTILTGEGGTGASRTQTPAPLRMEIPRPFRALRVDPPRRGLHLRGSQLARCGGHA